MDFQYHVSLDTFPQTWLNRSLLLLPPICVAVYNGEPAVHSPLTI